MKFARRRGLNPLPHDFCTAKYKMMIESKFVYSVHDFQSISQPYEKKVLNSNCYEDVVMLKVVEKLSSGVLMCLRKFVKRIDRVIRKSHKESHLSIRLYFICLSCGCLCSSSFLS